MMVPVILNGLKIDSNLYVMRGFNPLKSQIINNRNMGVYILIVFFRRGNTIVVLFADVKHLIHKVGIFSLQTNRKHRCLLAKKRWLLRTDNLDSGRAIFTKNAQTYVSFLKGNGGQHKITCREIIFFGIHFFIPVRLRKRFTLRSFLRNGLILGVLQQFWEMSFQFFQFFVAGAQFNFKGQKTALLFQCVGHRGINISKIIQFFAVIGNMNITLGEVVILSFIGMVTKKRDSIDLNRVFCRQHNCYLSCENYCFSCENKLISSHKIIFQKQKSKLKYDYK